MKRQKPPSILLSDIPEECRDVAKLIGVESFLRLARLRGGQELYIPKPESLERNARNRRIRARADGQSFRALAAQFRLSERQIRKIVQGGPT